MIVKTDAALESWTDLPRDIETPPMMVDRSNQEEHRD